MAGGIVFGLFVCASVCASRTVLTQYLEKSLTYFHLTFSIGVFLDYDECFKFWVQKVKIHSRRSIVLENALFGLVNVIT